MRLRSFDELHSALGLKPVAFLRCSKALSNTEGVDKAHEAADLASLWYHDAEHKSNQMHWLNTSICLEEDGGDDGLLLWGLYFIPYVACILPIKKSSPCWLDGTVHIPDSLLYGRGHEGVAFSADCGNFRYKETDKGNEEAG